MSWELSILKLLVQAAESIFKAKTLRANAKKAGRLTSEATQELLKPQPNLAAAEAKVREAERRLSNPTPALVAARNLLNKALAAMEAVPAPSRTSSGTARRSRVPVRKKKTTGRKKKTAARKKKTATRRKK